MFIYRRAGLMAGLTLKVGTVTVTNSGSNEYTGTPTVVFTGGGGTGAAATANMSSFSSPGSVTAVNISMNGTAWWTLGSALPTITINPNGSGSGATAVVDGWGTGQLVYGTGVVEVSAKPVTLTVSGGGGSGAVIANQNPGDFFTHRRGTFTNIFLASGGSGYTVVPTVVFTLRPGCTEVVRPVAVVGQTGGVCDNITLTTPGEWIRPNNSTGGPGYDVSLSGGNGSGATLVATNSQPFAALSWWAGPDAWAFDTILGLTITNRGSGFTSDPTITASNTVSGSISGFAGRRPLNAATVTNGGSGYTINTTASISGGTFVGGFTNTSWGTSVFGSWFTSYRVNTITVTNQGSGYRSAPAVSFSGGGQVVAATAVANMIPG
jgi:hypothetical protein